MLIRCSVLGLSSLYSVLGIDEDLLKKSRNTQFEEWKYQFRFLSIFSCLFFNFSASFEMEKLNEAQNIEHKFTIYFISNQKLDSHDMFTLNSIHFNIIFLAWSVRVCSSHFNRNISFKVIKLWSIDDLVVGVVCFFFCDNYTSELLQCRASHHFIRFHVIRDFYSRHEHF